MNDRVKIVVTVPENGADNLRKVIGEAGGGKIGNYSFCSFTIKGTGRFLPEENSKPSIGEIGKIEEVREERIEITCNASDAKKIVAIIRNSHPYEEPAIDVYQLINY